MGICILASQTIVGGEEPAQILLYIRISWKITYVPSTYWMFFVMKNYYWFQLLHIFRMIAQRVAYNRARLLIVCMLLVPDHADVEQIRANRRIPRPSSKPRMHWTVQNRHAICLQIICMSYISLFWVEKYLFYLYSNRLYCMHYLFQGSLSM